MISETQIKRAIATAPTAGKRSIEPKDGGERGAGRLTLLIRPFTGRVTAEWYAVWYRDGKRSSTKIASDPTLSLAEARRKFPKEFAPAISVGGSPVGAHVRSRGREEAQKLTIKELFDADIAELRRTGRRSADQAEAILSRAGEVIGEDRLAAEVEASNIVPHRSEIYERGAIVMASQGPGSA